MIYLILDVFYQENSGQTTAKVSGIRFTGIEKIEVLSGHTTVVNDVAPYQSGQFYKREMPCLLDLIKQIDEPFDIIIIDGYVFLDGINKAGLGKYLYDNLTVKQPIIGIAKNQFYEISDDYAVWRGISKHPLYVTSTGVNIIEAKSLVTRLEGKHRLPNIVNQVDRLGRS